MATKKKPTKTTSRQDKINDMKTEADKASAKATSAADPTPKKFQGANRAQESADSKVSSAKQLYQKLKQPDTLKGTPTEPSPSTDVTPKDPMPPGLRGMPEQAPPSPFGDPNLQPRPTSGIGTDPVDTMMPKAGELRSGMSRMGRGMSGGALVAAGLALAEWYREDPEGFKTHILDRFTPNQDTGFAQSMGAGIPNSTGADIPNTSVSANSVSPTDFSKSSGGSGIADVKPTAKDVRSQAKAKSGSSVRETGPALTDQEIIDWNRKNNKNYRD